MATRRRRSKIRRTRKLRQRGGSESHTVVLIEPRKRMQKALEFVVNNILDNLSHSWSMIVFPGKENIADVKSFIGTLPHAKQSRVTVKDLGLTTMNTSQYNHLMMSRRILDEISTDVFMVVQTDSLICKGGSHLLNKFMKYDYVGAPWKDRNALGNGGFSLRRKTKMLEILEKCPNKNHNEDGYFSGGCEGARPYTPSPEEAEEFSVETIFNGKQAFGIHKAWHHMPQNSDELEKKCIGYNSLNALNSQSGGSEAKPLKTAIMAIFKNESMILREWIEHYKWQGMDVILLLNNDSTDDWQSITKDYPGLVTVIDAPGRHQQLPAYNEKGLPFLREQGVDVVAVNDLDEYLFGTDGKNLKQHMQEVFSKPDRPSGFTCGWTMFGSSGHKAQPASVREGFTMRWSDHSEPENGISGKTVTLLADVGVLTSIHIPAVKGRLESCPAGLQLNHYQIMSEDYYRKVKMDRGNAYWGVSNGARKNFKYFTNRNHNRVEDLKLANLVKNAKQSGGGQKDITLAILCWKAFQTVRNTLNSYKANGLLDMVKPVIYFQERTPECDAIAAEYGITDIMGTQENTGILQALIDLINHSTTSYFIFAECDFELVHPKDKTSLILDECIKLLTEKNVDLVKLRDRKNPGVPLGSRQFVPGTDAEIQTAVIDPNFQWKLEALHFLDKPENTWKDVFEIVSFSQDPWYICDDKHNVWSNNTFITKISWLKEKVLPILAARPLNKNGKNDDKFSRMEGILGTQLRGNRYAAGHGLFKHNRLDR